MDTDTKETLDTESKENLDMNVGMPAEIKHLITEAFEKYCAEQREMEKDKAREKAIKRAEWKEYNKTVRGLLPLCLREFMVDKEDEGISPPINHLIARIEVPGLAEIVAKISEPENLAVSLIVSVPRKNHHNGFSISEDSVNYCFTDYPQSFHMSDLGGALLFARRSALHFNQLVTEMELEKQEYAKRQAERVKTPWWRAIRTLIREELAKVV